MTDARMLAERIYNRLSALPDGGWIHGNTFLPANVLCDHAGQQKFIEMIEKTINEFNAQTQDNKFSKIVVD